MPTSASPPVRPAHRTAAFAVTVLVVACALAVATSGVARSAPAQAQWVLTDLGSLGGTEGMSFATGINNRGQVVGWSRTKDGSYDGFLWENGRMRDLGGFVPVAINDRGQVAGSTSGIRGTGHGAHWVHAALWENGAVLPLGTVGGKGSYATAINDRGQVVGMSETKDGKRHAFLWTDGRMRDLGAFDPAAINDRGQVVGTGAVRSSPSSLTRSRAWLWEKGRLRVLGRGQASGIDERGRIVGTVGGRLATWTRSTPSGPITVLRLRPSVGGNHDVEFHVSINERGQVAATGGGEAYVWESGSRQVLPTLPGAQRSVATAINDRGQVVGASGRADHFEADRAVLWTPRTAG